MVLESVAHQVTKVAHNVSSVHDTVDTSATSHHILTSALV